MSCANSNPKDVIYQISLRVFTEGGDLHSAQKLLPQIADLGTDVVYLCPIVEADDDMNEVYWSKRQKANGFNNPRNPYRIKDYFKIDPEYGTDADLAAFVSEAHRLGLRVILDLVYFHCGPTCVFMKDQPTFVKRDENGEIDCSKKWCFPVLNFDDMGLREYLWSNMVYFVEKFDIDGYRCDVGNLVPLDFWAEGKSRIERVKPDMFMLCEGEDCDYVKEVFRLNYCYWTSSVIQCLSGQKQPAAFIQDAYESKAELVLAGHGKMITPIETHDTALNQGDKRIERRLGFDGMQAAIALSFLLKSAPFLFNGVEVCYAQPSNFFGNRFFPGHTTIPWENALTEFGAKRREFLKELIALYHNNEALWYADPECLCSGNDGVLAFRRTTERQSVVVAINLTDAPQSATFAVNARRILFARKAEASETGLNFLSYGIFVFEE